jgi:hypothetical protein
MDIQNQVRQAGVHSIILACVPARQLLTWVVSRSSTRHGLRSWSLIQSQVYPDTALQPHPQASELRRNWAFRAQVHRRRPDGTTSRCNSGSRIGCVEVPNHASARTRTHTTPRCT